MSTPCSSQALAIFGKCSEVEECASVITLQLPPEHGLSTIAGVHCDKNKINS